MIKCHIVQDLMPNYVDGLVHQDTQKDIQQHLQTCQSCRALYEQLSVPITGAPTASVDPLEVDYLKKVRKRTSRKWIIGGLILLLLFSVAIYFTAIGSLVKEENLTYTTSMVGDEWRIELQLTNGMSLLVKTEPIYGPADANGMKPIIGRRLKPYQLVPSPLLEKGNDSFMYGGTMNVIMEKEYKIELQLADHTVEFTSEQFFE